MVTTNSDVSSRSIAKAGGGFAVAAVLLYLLGWAVGWGEIVRTVRTADPLWLGLAVVSTTAGLVAWARVWDEVLSVLAVDIPFSSVTVAYFAATFADFVTPLGKAGGGPLIAYLVSADERMSYHEGLASVTTADLLNLVPLFAFAALGTAGLVVGGSLPRRADYFVAGLVGFALLLLATVAFVLARTADVEDALVAVLTSAARYLPGLEAASIRDDVTRISGELGRIADHPGVLVGSLVFAFLGWALFALPLYLAGQSLGVTLAPPLVLFVVPASTLAGLVPTPGGLGGVEVAVTGLLVALSSVDAGTAAAITLLYRVASYWFVVVVGGSLTLYEIYSV